MKYKKKGFDYTLLEKNVFMVPDEEQFIDFDSINVNNRQIVVELGCGNGHFLTGQAQKNNDLFYFGVDLKDYRIVKSRMKEINAKLNNVYWINGEAKKSLQNLFPNKSIRKIYMTFPDPWPKNRHHKHRLFQKDFCDLLYEKLNDLGQFIFISDHKEYYDWCIDLISNDDRFIITTHEYDPDLTESAFAKIWQLEDREFYSFTMAKK